MRMIAGGLITLSGALLWAAAAMTYTFAAKFDSGPPTAVLAIVGFILGFIGLSMAFYGDRSKP